MNKNIMPKKDFGFTLSNGRIKDIVGMTVKEARLKSKSLWLVCSDEKNNKRVITQLAIDKRKNGQPRLAAVEIIYDILSKEEGGRSEEAARVKMILEIGKVIGQKDKA